MLFDRLRNTGLTALVALGCFAACSDAEDPDPVTDETSETSTPTDSSGSSDDAAEKEPEPEPPAEPDPVPDSAPGVNLLVDPSFETDGTWEFTAEGYELPAERRIERASSGGSSFYFEIRSKRDFGEHPIIGTRVASQKIDIDAVPKRMKGKYRVDRWKPAPKPSATYLAVLISAIGADNFGPLVQPTKVLVLFNETGAMKFNIPNLRVAFRTQPEIFLGEWVEFDIDLHECFKDAWRKVPRGIEGLEVQFHVGFGGRIDHRISEVEADVYIDDFYLGN